MIEVWKELFGQSINIYVWLFILTCWFMLIKLELGSENIKLKISIIYFLFYLLALFNIFDIKILIIILILSTFVLIEFIFIDKFQRKILKKIIFYIFDYLYKIVFEYKFLYIFVSFLLISNFLKNVSKKILLIIKLNDIFTFNYLSIYLFFTTFLSIIILLRGIIKCINNEFETYNFEEIINKINKIQLFSKFIVNDKFKYFSNMLTYCEDKSYFYRKDTYNWFSFEFIYYRLIRIHNQCEKFKLWKIKSLRKIIFILYLSMKSFKLIIKIINNFITVLYKVFIKRKNIKYYMRGYSTIEMQLIRTLAVKDGYSTHVYQRKAYEFVYSKIFFSSLKEYYMYHHYSNIKMYKYYLVYLYICVAPIRIDRKRYKNIFELYEKHDLKNISNEEFYIWIYLLSHSKINSNIYNSDYINTYDLNKEKIKTNIKKIRNSKK